MQLAFAATMVLRSVSGVPHRDTYAPRQASTRCCVRAAALTSSRRALLETGAALVLGTAGLAGACHELLGPQVLVVVALVTGGVY